MLLLLLLVPFVESFSFGQLNLLRYSTLKGAETASRINYDYLHRPARSTTFPIFRLHSSAADKGSDEFAEDLTYITEEFLRLANGKSSITYQDFLQSEAIQAILTDEDDENYLADIEEIVIEKAKSLKVPIDLPMFIAINRAVDELFFYEDDEEDVDDIGVMQDNQMAGLDDIIQRRNNNEEEYEGIRI